MVDIRDNPDRPFGMIGLEWIIRIETPDSRTPFEVAAASQSEALVRVHYMFLRILNLLKPNYFKKQTISSSFLLSLFKYTGHKWPWSTQQASPVS